MSRPKLHWSPSPLPGYTIMGTVDIPGDFVKGYLHVEAKGWFVSAKWCWRVM